MLAALNNFIKYNFIIRTLIQILYEFRIRKALDLLRINNLDLFVSKVTSKTKIVTIITYSAVRNITITIYFVIIKSAVVENDSSVNRNKMSSLKVVILVVKKLTFR